MAVLRAPLPRCVWCLPRRPATYRGAPRDSRLHCRPAPRGMEATGSDRAVSAAPAIPLIDVTPFATWYAAHASASADASANPCPGSPAAGVVAAWRDALARFGFAHVAGHGVADGTIEAAHERAKAFFEDAPQRARDAVSARRLEDLMGAGAAQGRGYKRQGVITVAAAASAEAGGDRAPGSRTAQRPPPDYACEYIALGDGQDPPVDAVPGFAAAVQAFFDAMMRVNAMLMALTAASLGLPCDFFADSYVTPPRPGEPPKALSSLNRLRLAYYPSQAGRAPALGQLRYGEHTDWQGLTLLWQDHNVNGAPQCYGEGDRESHVPPPGGLEVAVPGVFLQEGGDAEAAPPAVSLDGCPGTATVFVPCPPQPRALTVNAGDLIEVWTNGAFKSCRHRVANPPLGSDSARLSLVLFTGPHPATPLAVLPSCSGAGPGGRAVGVHHAAAPDRPLTAGEHLAQRLRASGYG